MSTENNDTNENLGINGMSLNDYINTPEYKQKQKKAKTIKTIVTVSIITCLVLVIVIVINSINNQSYYGDSTADGSIFDSHYGSSSNNSEDHCMYCGSSPARAYHGKNGGGQKVTSYVCDECSSKCAFCGNKATKHYTAMLGNEIFVCNDCFKSMSGGN